MSETQNILERQRELEQYLRDLEHQKAVLRVSNEGADAVQRITDAITKLHDDAALKIDNKPTSRPTTLADMSKKELLDELEIAKKFLMIYESEALDYRTRAKLISKEIARHDEPPPTHSAGFCPSKEERTSAHLETVVIETPTIFRNSEVHRDCNENTIP